jgi:phospholipase/carboxylesterase
MLHTQFISAPEKDSRWLMLVLHGLGDSMAGYTWLPLALRLSWLNYLLVNAPDPYYGGFSWYDYAGDARPGVDRSRGELFSLLDAQRSAGFPTEQMFLFGFSQGCLMTLETGLRYPHVLAGLIGVSGYVLDPERLVTELSSVALRQRVLITHGRQDPMIPFSEVRAQIQFLKSKGIDVQWEEFDKEHTIAGEPELGLIRKFVEQSYNGSEASR